MCNRHGPCHVGREFVWSFVFGRMLPDDFPPTDERF